MLGEDWRDVIRPRTEQPHEVDAFLYMSSDAKIHVLTVVILLINEIYQSMSLLYPNTAVPLYPPTIKRYMIDFLLL